MNPAQSSSPLPAIEALLAEEIGLDPTSVSPNLVSRGVRARMGALGLHNVGAYESLLRKSPIELQELIEEIVISESWFFRDARPFCFLQEFAKSKFAESPIRPPLHILSLPCARGEEPLSIAMALKDAGINPSRFQIDGVDVSAKNLDYARRGLYTANAFRGTELAYRDRYFRSQGTGFQVDTSLLGSIRLIRASLFDPKLLEGESPYDLIFCRNLLIYLSPEARNRALHILNSLLASDGVLIVGHADHLGPEGSRLFAPTGELSYFAFRKVKEIVPTSPSLSLADLGVRMPNCEPVEFPVRSTETRLIAAREAAASAEAVPDLLMQACECANLGKYHQAMQLIEKQLHAKGPNAPAYYLMGILSQSVGDRAQAERSFHKAVYLDPSHDEALLALALLADRRGDITAASGFRRRAERALVAKGVN